MNLRAEEQILIKDIFAVSVNQSESSLMYLPEFVRDVSGFGPNASLNEHSTYFDSLLMERLQVPQTDVLSYLEESWARAEDARSKPWNAAPQQQQFIDYSVEIIKNFISLSLQESQIFPEQMQIQSDISPAPTKTNQIARKLLTHFQRKGLNLQMLQIVLKSNDEVQLREDFLEVLVTRQRFVTIIDSKALFYLSTLIELLRDPEFKGVFLKMRGIRFVPDGEKGGAVLDSFTAFGLFMRPSILGQKISGHIYQQGIALERFEERMIDQLGNDRLSRQKMRMFSSLQSEYNSKLLEAYKELMRKESQKLFLAWNYRLLTTNLARMKLGHRIYKQQNEDLSHDGILVNAYSCLLGLCKAITNMSDEKWKAIDPTYFIHHPQAHLLRGDPFCNKPAPANHQKKQFGTITEFFFLALEFLHVGICGAMQNFNMYNQMKKNMERQMENVVSRLPANHPMRKKAALEVAKIQSKIIRYWILLNDDGLIHQTIKLLSLLLQQLPRWMGINYQRLRRARLEEKPGQMIHYLPELLLTLVSQYHTTMFSIKQGYLSMLGDRHIRLVLELSCFLLSEHDAVTNPYISAGYVEMLFMWLHDQKARVVHQQLRASPVVLNNITCGLIRFYCGIANTGRSNQFYEKFKYRQCANKIFTTLWRYEEFRQDLQGYFSSSLFEKFINNILTDTNYSLDETNENYEKYRQLLDKKAEGPLSQEDQQNQQTIGRIMGANLEMVKSNLRLMRELSVWSPGTFLSEVDRKDAVPLLNNALKTFVDAGSFTSNRQLLARFKFEGGRQLSNLVQIYGNLDINEILSNEIVKDGRNYKKQFFIKALQRASNQHYTSIDGLERFEGLINKLSTAENQEENEQEIYGEIPEKYLCALLSNLMVDPVRLPGSQVVDRVNIRRVLLKDERDPFTRSPLREADLVPDEELKLEITRWKKKRLEQLKKGDKKLKYGKIATNQVENQEGTFGINPMIEQE